MPTRQPRVALALPPEVLAVLDRMSRVTGAGRATLIREWLIEGLPLLEQLASAMETASQRHLDAFKVMIETLDQVSSMTGQMSLDLRKKRRAAMRKRKRQESADT